MLFFITVGVIDPSPDDHKHSPLINDGRPRYNDGDGHGDDDSTDPRVSGVFHPDSDDVHQLEEEEGYPEGTGEYFNYMPRSPIKNRGEKSVGNFHHKAR